MSALRAVFTTKPCLPYTRRQESEMVGDTRLYVGDGGRGAPPSLKSFTASSFFSRADGLRPR